ncbi:putative RNA-directed DNA polymerase from transposon BS [Trichonephila clavipes]|uniref:Putative RNA-directed DNA polymerase from transposon BS n=1 Tax=Trichonephila clavipes TaxID=2585209 RepID=A0A8X6VL47_TRICX|nr:putative RNA-directed DNA polymerase from transposon BS [Trichonephila clavipes]
MRASRIFLGCRSDTHRGTSIFNRDFRVNELEVAIGDSCLNKYPGPDGIHSQMIYHHGLSERQISGHLHQFFLELGAACSRLEGSVLSLTLFSLYLSDIESVIKRKCEVSVFVDDTVLWKSDSDLTKLERDINLVLEDIQNFTLDHKLTFNPTMSTVKFVTTNRKLYNFHPNILLHDQPLTVDKHPKYLGFVLDPEILGNKHIDHIVFKTRKRFNILRYISGRDWGADTGTLRNTYISLIRPILEYGAPVYCGIYVTHL